MGSSGSRQQMLTTDASKFKVGEKVECKDNNEADWKRGVVVCLEPLKVLPERWSGDKGFQWDSVRKLNLTLKDEIRQKIGLDKDSPIWDLEHDHVYKDQSPRMQGRTAYIPPPDGTIKLTCKIQNVEKGFWDWPIAYHGTTISNVRSILQDRLRIRGGGKVDRSTTACKYGEGVYCSPSITVAKGYSKKCEIWGDNYYPILFVRCRPDTLKEACDAISCGAAEREIHSSEDPYFGKTPIWLMPDEEDIEVVGVLFVPESAFSS